MARIRENFDEQAAEERVNTDLEQGLSDYKAKYGSIVKELEELEKVLPEKLAAIQREINSLNDRLIDIDKEANEATNAIGHHGNTLVQCLTDVRSLAKAINNGATAYTPLVGVLKAVRTSVDAQIELLKSKDPKDIFLAGNELLRQVECLGHYHTCATKCLEPPQEYNNITIKEKLKAIEMS
ncbi:unnamed protein product [Rotaria sp. Silwood2]|nr:unnamed protein product [Rotaria sp. Silwood2]